MKRSSKILAILLSVCLIFGVVFALVASAATAVQELNVGTLSGGYADFDNYTNNSLHSNGGTQALDLVGSKVYI